MEEWEYLYIERIRDEFRKKGLQRQIDPAFRVSILESQLGQAIHWVNRKIAVPETFNREEFKTSVGESLVHIYLLAESMGISCRDISFDDACKRIMEHIPRLKV